MKDILKGTKRLMSRGFSKSLDYVEIVGNKLPHPATIFALLALLVMIISWLASTFSYQAVHPVSGDIIEANSLFSSDGIRWIYTNIIWNFVNFPPWVMYWL